MEMGKIVNPLKGKRGFAGMDSVRVAEIASLGGIAAHKLGVAHEYTSEEAARAGKLGGLAVSRDREHMARIGRIGGKKSRKGRA